MPSIVPVSAGLPGIGPGSAGFTSTDLASDDLDSECLPSLALCSTGLPSEDLASADLDSEFLASAAVPADGLAGFVAVGLLPELPLDVVGEIVEQAERLSPRISANVAEGFEPDRIKFLHRHPSRSNSIRNFNATSVYYL